MQLEMQRQPFVRSRVLSATIALMAVLALGPPHARARDLPKSDPDRKLILDSARGQDNVKFIVKDLYKDGDFAFLCALEQEPEGGIIGTDEALDVYEFVLIRDAGRWTAHDAGGAFAASVSSASCSSAGRAGGDDFRIKSKADIVDRLVQAIRWDLLQDLAGRHPIDDVLPLLDLLRQKGLETGISMDDEKVLHDFRVSLLNEACNNSAPCKAKNKRIFSRIESLRKSDHVNALAWGVCDHTASRTKSAAAFEGCLKLAAAEPACRTGLRLPQDRQTLEQCAATLSR